MEQVNGGELFEHINTYELDEKEVAVIMYQLIDVIYYLQCSGIVHRDLKTENILV
jgi:serine/threonine protein kinase